MLEVNKIYNADCLELMKQLPDKCIDLVLTDPPYGKKPLRKTDTSNGIGVASVNFKVGEDNWDIKPTAEYFNEIIRISKNQIIFGGNYFTDILQPSNCWIVWDKIGSGNFKNPFADCELAWTSFNSVIKKYTCVQQGFVNEDKKQDAF